MRRVHLRPLLACGLAVVGLLGCDKTRTDAEEVLPKRSVIGDQITHLSIGVGDIWEGGYSVDVVPGEYAVIEHKKCPDEKEAATPSSQGRGLCVIRITEDQSRRFETAMSRFKARARPLETISLDDKDLRPDGKPCRLNATDQRMISLFWTGTDGVRMASFYEGCDQDEFKDYYRSVLSVTDALPMKGIFSND